MEIRRQDNGDIGDDEEVGDVTERTPKKEPTPKGDQPELSINIISNYFKPFPKLKHKPSKDHEIMIPINCNDSLKDQESKHMTNKYFFLLF